MSETVQITTILKLLENNPDKEFTRRDFDGCKVSDKLARLFKQGFVDRREGHVDKTNRYIMFYRIRREDNSNEWRYFNKSNRKQRD